MSKKVIFLVLLAITLTLAKKGPPKKDEIKEAVQKLHQPLYKLLAEKSKVEYQKIEAAKLKQEDRTELIFEVKKFVTNIKLTIAGKQSVLGTKLREAGLGSEEYNKILKEVEPEVKAAESKISGKCDEFSKTVDNLIKEKKGKQ